MAGVLTPLLRLLEGCLHALSSCFARWTKPLTSSLPLQTLADLRRSRSELVAENALLRQQLIILKRQVKRPACTNKDRVLLLLLARLVHTWQNALLIVQPDTRLAVASGALSGALEAQIQGAREKAEALVRDDQREQRDGSKQPTLADRIGKRSCVIMRQRYAPVIFCRSPISSSVRFLPFFSSN